MRLWGLSGGNGNSLCPQSSLCADVFLDVAFGGGDAPRPSCSHFFGAPGLAAQKLGCEMALWGALLLKRRLRVRIGCSQS